MTKSLSTPRKALVVGGSLGGLFAATALRAVGWNVEIFERSPGMLDSRGGGIVLQGEVLRALQFAQIPHAQSLGVRSRNRSYFDRLGNDLSREYMPQTQTSWNLLYNTLMGSFPEENYHHGATLTGIEQHDQGVTANFEDGSRAQGDLLIGADGGDSAVRSLTMPGTSPSYSGYVAWRGLVDENKLPESAKARIFEDFVFQHDAESMMLEYMVPGEDGSVQPGHRRFNWLWYLKAACGPELDAVLTDGDGRRRRHSVPPGALAPDQDAWIRRMGKERLNPAFRALIDNTDEIFVQSIIDFQVSKMVFGRVLLTGDAAFIPRPHTAGSTAKAAANAVALATAIAGNASLDEALLRWQQQQVSEGIQMTKWGVDMGNRIMGITRH
jgi:2-polyprenyl-6-methoxyphenol hydroxylase-like FAD-dependent oxidoreductase